MTEPISDALRDAIGDQEVGRRLPRGLTPFRSPAYRWLAVSLTASSFAGGVWVVALVWEVTRLGGGPTDLSFVTTASAIGVQLPTLVAGVAADRVPQRLILVAVAVVEVLGLGLVALLSSMGLSSLWLLAAVGRASPVRSWPRRAPPPRSPSLRQLGGHGAGAAQGAADADPAHPRRRAHGAPGALGRARHA